MPQQFQTRYAFQGGINNSLSDELIGENELSDARNYIPDLNTAGALIKREGVTTASTQQSATISSIYQGRNGDYFTSGTNLCIWAGTSLQAITAGYPDWASFATYDLMVNGTNALKTSDGSAFSAIANCPAGAKYIAAVNNFVYVAGHDRGKLRWADIGTLETWTVTNELVLSQDQDDDIMAMKPWRNVLLVLSGQSFTMVSGYNTLEMGISYYSKEEGITGSHRSMVVTPAGVFWWCKSGIVWLKPDLSIDYPMLRKLPKTIANLNRAYDGYVHGAYDPTYKKVCFYLFNGLAQTTCNLRADYYIDRDAFYLHDGAGVQMASSAWGFDAGLPYLWCGGYGTTYLYRINLATDNAVAIESYLETRRESSPALYSKSRRVTLTTGLTTQDVVNYGVYIDNDTAVDTSWANTIATGVVDTHIGTNRLYRKIKHRISDSSTDRTRIIGLTHDGVNLRAL